MMLSVALLVFLMESTTGTGCDNHSRPTAHSKQQGIELAVQKGDAAMENKSKVLLMRYDALSKGPQELSLTIFHTQAAWDDFVKKFSGINKEDLVKLSIDWSTSVLLVIRLLEDSGMDTSPDIDIFSRAGDTVTIRFVMKLRPDAKMLDVITYPWFIVEAPAQAFVGDPIVHFSISYSGREKPGDKIYHQR
jgi:hypothetical protein